jgi:hypothetical protein
LKEERGGRGRKEGEKDSKPPGPLKVWFKGVKASGKEEGGELSKRGEEQKKRTTK